MRRVIKPWGCEEIWAENEKYVGKIMTIAPGQRMSLQYHEKKEETIYVLSGELKVWDSQDDENFKLLNKGQIFHVNPGKVHRFGASNAGPVKLIEVSTPELDDVVRIADDYKR